MRLGFAEVLMVLFIIVLLFGATRLPALGKGLAKSIKNFKDATGGGSDKPE